MLFYSASSLTPAMYLAINAFSQHNHITARVGSFQSSQCLGPSIIRYCCRSVTTRNICIVILRCKRLAIALSPHLYVLYNAPYNCKPYSNPSRILPKDTQIKRNHNANLWNLCKGYICINALTHHVFYVAMSP